MRLGRPHFLVGGLLLYGLGATVALYQGAHFRLPAYVLGQLAITAFQLMTHYANDYFDLSADVANQTPTRFSGGSRVLTEGDLPPIAAKVAALSLAGIGIALTAVAAIRLPVRPHGGGGALIALVLLLAGGLAWAYSAPPFVLHSRGWGEVTTAVVVTGLTPLSGYLMQHESGGWLSQGLRVIDKQMAMLAPADASGAEAAASVSPTLLFWPCCRWRSFNSIC